MASPEAAVIAALKADAGVTALAGDRVFIWGGKQDVAYPYITLQRISTQGAPHLTGPSDLDWPRFQIDVWAMTALEAINAAEAVRVAIDAVPQTIDGLTFVATFQDQQGPSPDPETRNFRTSQDFLVWHNR